MHREFLSYLLVLVVASLAGCDRGAEVRAQNQPPLPSQQHAPSAPLLIGLIPEQNIFKQMERYEPLAQYLAKKTGAAIRLRILLRYGNIISNFTAEGMDGAFFGSFTYALAHSRLGVNVLARPEGRDGRSTYHGLIFVRRDSGIKSAGDMAGKRFVLVDKATTAGYLLPLAYFKEKGIAYRSFLREIYFAGTHENAILDVLNRKADIGAAKNTVFDRLAASNSRIKAELEVLERSPDVPENALAFRKDLDASLTAKIRQALLAMHGDPEGRLVLDAFGARRFIATNEDDYGVVYRYARDAGLDLASYDYLND